MNIVAGIMFFGFLIAVFYPLYKQRKNVSVVAEEKWEEEDKTIYVIYGNYEIPILQSQLVRWEKMNPNEKWGMLQILLQQVKDKKLTTEKTAGITRFIAITEKGKDIKHRQKQRTEAWNQ